MVIGLIEDTNRKPLYITYDGKSQTADEQILLKAAYLKIADIVSGYGWYGHYQPTTVNVPATERVWKESYTYDLNGNRETKTTAFGTIWYTYDDENRLRFSGRDKLVNVDEEIGGRTTNWDDLTQTEWYAATDETNYTTNSLKGTRFTYDRNGNMLSSENLYSVKFFDYDATNRMALSTVTDLIDHTYTATTYAYDALGRRTLTQTEGHTAERTLYDGMSFEVLRQGTADSNGRFVSTDVAKGRFNYGYGFPFNSYTTYNSSGNWIFDMFFGGMWGFGAGAHGSNNGQEADPEYYDIENLYPLYGNGEAVATYEEDLVYSPHETFWNNWGGFYSGLFGTRESYYSTYSETNYFATDLLGSVKVTTNARGEVSGKTSYDVFGSLYGSNGTLAESSLMFAYTGKTWNDITELSNYGFRDYAPQIARFTTVDPIRDGSNWYAYVHNDPVNCVDLWGLTASDSTANRFHIGQDVSGSTFTTSMITDPDSLDRQRMEKIVTRYNQGIKSTSGFTSTHSACDEYTTKVMESGGVKPDNWPDPNDNYVGPAKGNPNYKESLSGGKKTPSAGTNAVIMEGGTFSTDPHMVYILFNPYSNGDTITSTEFTTIDNETGKRGIITQTFENQDAFEANYGYDSFSYYGVDTL